MVNHLALVMDGNRRWAKQNKLLAWQGHYHGIKAVEQSIEFCLENSIKYLSLYAFSLENFKRSEIEKKYLFNLLLKFIKNFTLKLISNQIRVKFIGDKSYFPNNIIDSIQDLENKTKNFRKLNINILFCYGGQQEIINAINLALKEKKENINIETFKNYLWYNKYNNNNIPDPDLIIRTGGQKRLSNFLLFQAAYSELLFIDKYWPDFNKKDLELSLIEYNSRKKNYGQ